MTAAANSKLVTRIFSSSDQPTKAIIGLHGWTGDEHVFEPVAKMMNIDDAQWFFPRAPYKADSGKGYSWFSGTDETGWDIEKTRVGIHQLLADIRSEGFSPKNIFLIGFSQGASLAIVPIAGFIKFKDVLANEATEESKNTPVLLLHGNQDEIIHVTASEKAHDFFKERGNPVYFKRYDGGHKIPKRTGPIVKNFISDSFNFLEVILSETLK